MDISSTKWSSSSGVTAKNSQQTQSPISQFKSNTTNVSFSSLALKLKDAQRSIDNAQVKQLPLVWNGQKALKSEQLNKQEVAAARWEFEQLSKAQLETIALDPGGTFSDVEKVAAYEQWHVLDQMALSSMQRESLEHENPLDAITGFEKAVNSHTQSFSVLGKAMVSEQYASNAQAKFEAIINEQDKALHKTTSQSEHYYTMMVKDIFAGDEPNVLSGVDGMSLSNISKSPFEFLTQEDRLLLADMYEYADQNDIDFKYIQRLASDLGDYRKHNDGKLVSNFNSGHFDEHGHQLSVGFTEKDQATIDSLRSGSALASSRLDQGFVSFLTDPGLGALSHVGSYQFLQHMVEVTAGSQTSVSAGNFEVFKDFSSTVERYVMSTSEEAITRPEPDVVCKNGHCEVTEKGRQNGVTLAQDEKAMSPAIDLKSESIESLIQQFKNTEKQESIWYQWLADD
ncbi:hypothetical protein N480_23760 [Pseudoalteromonas luteoviolacea S2607]|uniref:hypothetical protein n=1 Tax=Pseudoalteromonas luteoviolacea TaxID=43657 RepID=UPI0007B0B5E5|nr:hypothetical protein [Pseudoalteromonas luteoviolacea]KZN33542.1 hypothetical protein N480_23760 [Pseudoalteromonas luteoviolacea S2607]